MTYVSEDSDPLFEPAVFSLLQATLELLRMAMRQADRANMPKLARDILDVRDQALLVYSALGHDLGELD